MLWQPLWRPEHIVIKRKDWIAGGLPEVPDEGSEAEQEAGAKSKKMRPFNQA